MLGYLSPSLTHSIDMDVIKVTYLNKISDVLRQGVSTGLNVFDFADSLSSTQYRSKSWLVDTLKVKNLKPNPRILILGGWYGSYLVPLLRERIEPSHIFFNDKDINCIKVAKKLHGNNNISYHCFDATTSHEQMSPDVVINTSCEHMESYTCMMSQNPNSLFALQTCDNKNDPGHVNTSFSTEDFIKKLELSTILYGGRISLGHKNRFMVIGTIR